MANQPSKKPQKGSEPPPISQKPLLNAKKSSISTTLVMATGVALFVASITICYAVLPDELPWALQKLVGLVMACLAAGACFLVMYRPKPDDLKQQIQRGQHVDFGKQLRLEKKKTRTVKLPLLGETSFRPIVSLLAFFVVAGWWFTPIAPIQVKARPIEDLSVLLGDEIMALVLTLADETLATPYPPVAPRQMHQLAARIDEDATPYQLTMKAVVEGHHQKARDLVKKATGTPAGTIRLVKAQNELLAHQFTQAVQRYQEALETEPNKPIVLFQTIAALIHSGDYETALPIADRAIELCRKMPATDNRHLGIALHLRIALSILQYRDLDQAEQMLSESQTILQESFGETSSFYAASLNNQAILAALRDRLPGAHNAISLAHSLWSQSYEPDHPYLATSRMNKAFFHYLQGEYREALEIEREIRPKSDNQPEDEQRTRPDFDQHLTTMLELALNEPTRNPTRVEQDLVVLESWLGTDHPQIIAWLNVLTELHLAQARYRRAEVYAIRALDLTQKAFGAEPPDTHPCMAEPLGRLARLYLITHRDAEALDRAEEAFAPSQTALGDKHPTVARYLCILGHACRTNDKMSESRRHFDQAIEIYKEAFPDGHPRLALALGDQAIFEGTPTRYRQGANQFKQAIKMAEEYLGENHPNVAELNSNLALLYMERRKFDPAKPYVLRTIQIREQSFPPDHPLIADSMDLHAQWLTGAQPDSSKKEVQNLEKRARSIRARHKEIDRPE